MTEAHTVEACVECDSPSVTERVTEPAESRYRCKACGHIGPDVNARPAKSMSPDGAHRRALLEADPDDYP